MALAIFIGLVGCSQLNVENSLTSDSANAENVNIPVNKYVLDNGLVLLVVENHQLPIFSYYTFYNVGGRYEAGKTTGATHFLEHLMFKGTKHYPFGIFDSKIEGNGGSTNAFTTFDQTVYYESLPTTQLEDIMKMEVDRMNYLDIKKDLFEKERKVVLEERKMRYENSPVGNLYLRMMQEVFKGTPYGGSVIGEVKNLVEFTPEIIKGFYDQFYAPNNAVVVIVGDVDASSVHSMAKKYYGELDSSETFQKIKQKRDIPSIYTFKKHFSSDLNLWSTSPQPIFMMAFKGFPLGTKDALAADLLAGILSGSRNAYLDRKYVQTRRPLLSKVSANNYNLKMSGTFFLFGQLLKKVSLNKVRKMFKQEYRQICEKGLDQRSLLRTKNQFLVDYFQSIQTNAEVAQFIGVRESLFGDYNSYKDELKVYSSLTLDDVRNVCKKIFSKNEHIFVTTWNKNRRTKSKN
jgi:zinc protease